MRALSLIFGLALAAALASSAQAAGQGSELICPSIMQPVCASGAGGTKTFPNRCLAEGAGFSVVKEGSCDGTPGRRLAQTVCTREYLPVCAERNGLGKTFGNACEARAAGYAIVAQGEC